MADDRIDALYDLDPGEFTAARDRLAADLREAGDREAATEIKGLRRPSVPAWAVNQLIRRHRSEVQELLSVAGDLREAQRAAMSGKGAEELAEIGNRRRRVIDRLVNRAEELLAEGGHAAGRTTLDRVADTLMAATVDEDAAGAVREGRLERELQPPSGFEALLEGAPPPAPKKKRAPDRKARERAEEARREARAARDEAGEAEREARRLEREAERARRRAEEARERAERAAARAEEAVERARDAGR